MNFRSSQKQTFEVFSNSFGDIMFFLMLFFLIASTMITPGAIKVALPQANDAPSIQKPPKEVAISITKDLKYYFNDKQVNFNELEPLLKKVAGESSEAIAIVRCDNTIAVQALVDVFQIGNDVKVKMVLATTRKDKDKEE
ncbi:MAG TPA: biopolymer transporter ExbD [Prolixibacteraceae bacterium]|nr:biopolymer transporter ExbD [Prolixibacteraceae bacterium]HPS11982.1 biopolymer transporter ExbD [Prolixibacteraceae bacterium]